ncbi:hypothetical protein ACE7GA_09345 [Roseomonas sp. CCTCC AB2023176]|uniref:hypothetical protein n=1 Tax=Roseomonas sp. CCTCC AB2023176 TaxID=3342640 RepID=UPI0035D76D74
MLHWVAPRYHTGPIRPGTAARVGEDRLLARGSLAETLPGAAARLRDPASAGPTDPAATASPALLAALAEALARAPSPPLLAWLRGAVDRALARPGTPPPGTLLAAAILHRDDAPRLAELAGRLGPVEDATALLAAARLARRAPEAAVALMEAPLLHDRGAVAPESLPTVELATLLRALRAAAAAGAIPPGRLDDRIARTLDALSARIRERDGALEVVASDAATEGDTLSTAATLLALLGPAGDPG